MGLSDWIQFIKTSFKGSDFKYRFHCIFNLLPHHLQATPSKQNHDFLFRLESPRKMFHRLWIIVDFYSNRLTTFIRVHISDPWLFIQSSFRRFLDTKSWMWHSGSERLTIEFRWSLLGSFIRHLPRFRSFDGHPIFQHLEHVHGKVFYSNFL